MSWGDELWDRYDSVAVYVGQTTRELDTWYGNFFKERSKIENEYAKNLRKLIKTYKPKNKKKNPEDESTQAVGFRYSNSEMSMHINNFTCQVNSRGTWISSWPT